jgi:hypothetical protein
MLNFGSLSVKHENGRRLVKLYKHTAPADANVNKRPDPSRVEVVVPALQLAAECWPR